MQSVTSQRDIGQFPISRRGFSRITERIYRLWKKHISGIKLISLAIGIGLIILFSPKAEAVFFLPDGPVQLAPLDPESIDRKTDSPIIDSILFLNQEELAPVNLEHNPESPHSFLARGIPEAPTVGQLLNDILQEKGDRGYEHYINQWVTRKGEKARLTDEKLAFIWREAERINLDPFYFLAILAKEGTGSFDTLPSPEGGQPHPNFEKDAIRAADLIKREIDEWRENGSPGDWLRWVNYGNGGNIYTDGYAEDIGNLNASPPRPAWWEVVIDIYNGPRLKVKENK